MDKKDIGISGKAFDELVEDMGIESFPEGEKNEMLSKITELVLKRIFVEAMEKIGESGRREYEELVAKNAGEEELRAFFSSKINDFDGFTVGVMESLRDEMASGL